MPPQYLLGLFAALLPAALPPAPSRLPLPWNATGHPLVALVAWSQTSPNARAGAVALLRKHPRFAEDFEGNMPQAVRDDETLQDQWIFMHAATWPDIARGFKGADSKKYHHATWHYINWPIYLDEQTEQAIGKPPVNFSTTWKSGMDESNLNCVQALPMVRAKLDPAGVAPSRRQPGPCWCAGSSTWWGTSTSRSTQAPCSRPVASRRGRGRQLDPHPRPRQPFTPTGTRPSARPGVRLSRSIQGSAAGSLSRASSRPGRTAEKSLSARTCRKESTALAFEHVYSDAIVQAVAEADADRSLGALPLATDHTQNSSEVGKCRAVESGFRLAVTCDTLFDH